ncbi:MAG: CBS domain-containing protein [Rhodospirillales bacterium]|nr:CBS domain-containing protein [Rhodospirillales bacterium]
MQAKDIMTSPPITVAPTMDVQEVARCLLDHAISAVPVVDDAGNLAGIVSEGDLMRRPESGTNRQPSWWLTIFATPEAQSVDYLKAHGRRARDVMTRDVVTVTHDAALDDVAATMEEHRIKRVPVMREGKVVGIVSRANLLHGLIAWRRAPVPIAGDEDVRTSILAAFEDAGVRAELVNVVVSDGVADLWGVTGSVEEIRAAGAAAENSVGVKAVNNHLNVFPLLVRNSMGAV